MVYLLSPACPVPVPSASNTATDSSCGSSPCIRYNSPPVSLILHYKSSFIGGLLFDFNKGNKILTMFLLLLILCLPAYSSCANIAWKVIHGVQEKEKINNNYSILEAEWFKKKKLVLLLL